MTAREQAQSADVAPRPGSAKLEYPAFLTTPEPLEVDLRHGAHALLGLSNTMLDLHLPGQPMRLMSEMQRVIQEVEQQPHPRCFKLSAGARLLQELFGPATEFATNSIFQARIRALCVIMTCLERVAVEHYGRQPLMPPGMVAVPAKAEKGRQR